jgi:hypothetical protein
MVWVDKPHASDFRTSATCQAVVPPPRDCSVFRRWSLNVAWFEWPISWFGVLAAPFMRAPCGLTTPQVRSPLLTPSALDDGEGGRFWAFRSTFSSPNGNWLAGCTLRRLTSPGSLQSVRSMLSVVIVLLRGRTTAGNIASLGWQHNVSFSWKFLF